MSKRKPTPNYKLMFESAVRALQVAYEEYKKASRERLRWTFFDHDGRFSIMEGYADRRKRAEDAEQEVARLMQEVEALRVRKEQRDE